MAVKRGSSIMELLLACISAVLVLTGGILLFLSGVRLTVKSQATSHAMRSGSSSIDRLRIQLSEATAFVLPEKEESVNSGSSKLWSSSLGSISQYQSKNPKSEQEILLTAVYLALPSPHNVTVQLGASKSQTLALPTRSKATQGVLLYRGTEYGKPDSRSGTSLWMWRYDNGKLISKNSLTNRLSESWDAVAFRRDTGGISNLLRYRLVTAEKDTSNQESSQFGSKNTLSGTNAGSDYAITLLNFGDGAIPSATFPVNGAEKP
jgi:hypothetical protein